ncbi:MAG: DUF4293 domain-containing protein [Bacteroidota bacterium]|nr:DUF4293 domain-containing protein [Bacteroidota bacterium]
MIQRIQSLYLALSVVACGLLFFFPMAVFVHPSGIYNFFIYGIKYMLEPPMILNFWLVFPALAMIIIATILTASSIFLYKNRKLQVLFVSIAFLLHVILISVILLFYISHFEDIYGIHSYKFGIFLPLISLGLLILANRAIRKDEALVKSADRLR